MTNLSIAHTRDIFQAVKEIPFPEVLQAFHGAEIRKNKVPCPFHQEKDPSFHVYPKGFKCYGCGESGDGTTFVSKLLGLRPVDAAKLIAEKFGIPFGDKPLSKEEKKRLAKQKAERELKKKVEIGFREWTKQTTITIRTLTEAIRLLLEEKGIEIEKELIPLVHELPRLEYWADTLASGNDEEILQIYRDPEARRWCS